MSMFFMIFGNAERSLLLAKIMFLLHSISGSVDCSRMALASSVQVSYQYCVHFGMFFRRGGVNLSFYVFSAQFSSPSTIRNANKTPKNKHSMSAVYKAVILPQMVLVGNQGCIHNLHPLRVVALAIFMFSVIFGEAKRSVLPARIMFLQYSVSGSVDGAPMGLASSVPVSYQYCVHVGGVLSSGRCKFVFSYILRPN